MKKSSKTAIIIGAAIAKLLCVFIVIWLSYCGINIITTRLEWNVDSSLDGYFTEWENETDENFAFFYPHRLFFSAENAYSDDYVYIHEDYELRVYCIKDDKIYFGYATLAENTKQSRIWHIASMGMDGENVTEYYSGDMFPEEYNYYDCRYRNLNRLSDWDGVYGGLYWNGSIYLRGAARTVEYNTESGELNENASLPDRECVCEKESNSLFYIKDSSGNVIKTLDIKKMAEGDVYARQLSELSENKIWSGKSAIGDIDVEWTDSSNFYFLVTVYNYHGSQYAVLFKYDTETDGISYIRNIYIDDSRSSDCATFVRIYS